MSSDSSTRQLDSPDQESDDANSAITAHKFAHALIAGHQSPIKVSGECEDNHLEQLARAETEN
jgi:hypothetical protein